jgi:hypothetical protein
MSDTGDKTYHERVANGNSHIIVLIKNFHFGLIKQVFDHEEKTKQEQMSAQERLAYHQAYSAPVMAGLNTGWRDKWSGGRSSPIVPWAKRLPTGWIIGQP